jgi:hypothetical protein
MSKPTVISIDGVDYIRKDAASEMNTENAVIVRCDRAGVFFGYLHKSDLPSGIVELKQARRLWFWSGAASLSQMAVDGTSKPKECKFPVAVPHITVTGVIEVIPCSQKAVDSINSVATWKQ